MRTPRKLKKALKGKKYKNANLKLLYDIAEQQVRKEYEKALDKWHYDQIKNSFLYKSESK